MTLPGCAVLCPLEDFITLTKDVVPDDWERECLFKAGKYAEKYQYNLNTAVAISNYSPCCIACIKYLLMIFLDVTRCSHTFVRAYSSNSNYPLFVCSSNPDVSYTVGTFTSSTSNRLHVLARQKGTQAVLFSSDNWRHIRNIGHKLEWRSEREIQLLIIDVLAIKLIVIFLVNVYNECFISNFTFTLGQKMLCVHNRKKWYREDNLHLSTYCSENRFSLSSSFIFCRVRVRYMIALID